MHCIQCKQTFTYGSNTAWKKYCNVFRIAITININSEFSKVIEILNEMLGCGVSSTVDNQKSPNISHIWMGIWNIEYKIAVENDSKTITYLGLWCFFMCFKTFLRLWCENSVQNGHRYSNPEGEWQLATWDTKCTLAWKNTWHFLHLNGKLLFSLSELSSTTIMTSILLFSDGFSWIFTTVFIFAFGMQFLKKIFDCFNCESQFSVLYYCLEIMEFELSLFSRSYLETNL